MASLTRVMIIRHAEKPGADGKPRGVDRNGKQRDSSLTVTGWQRAGALANLFAGSSAAPLITPSVIYASDPDYGSSRSLETVLPLSLKLGVKPIRSFAKGQESDLANSVLSQEGAVLISWPHERIIDIAAHLTASAPPNDRLPSNWPNERYDIVWVLTPPTIFRRRWAFTQVPQMLLAGDSAALVT
jgi:hypothetical protein